MGLTKATYTGVEPIMDYFDEVMQDENFTVSLWHSQKDIAYQWNNPDKDKIRQRLYEGLQAAERAENDNLMYLKFHPGTVKGFIDGKTTVVCMSPIRVCELKGSISGVVSPGEATGNMPYKMYEAIDAIKGLPQAINDKLSSFDERLRLIEDSDIEPEPEPDKVERVIGQISGLLSNPAIMGVIGSVLKLITPNLPIMPQQTINGATDENPIDEEMMYNSLERLRVHCRVDTDLKLLADMAETNKPMFDFVLNNLRAMKS